MNAAQHVRKNPKNGFTLIEMLVVLGVLTIIIALIIIAVNPAKQFAQSRNVKRRGDLVTISNAVYQYYATTGELPNEIESSTKNISNEGYDICDSLVKEYISALPVDPSRGSYDDCDDYNTGYTIELEEENRIKMKAVHAELGETIEVER